MVIKMEVTTLLCDSSICRLCAEENRNGTDLFSPQEDKQDLSELVNRYLPLKVYKDEKYPCTICPGCNIQLEATKSFFDLIIERQSKLRELLAKQQEILKRQDKQRQQLENALKLVNPSSSVGAYTIQEDEAGEKFLIQIVADGPLFTAEHELSLKSEGLNKPRRKRGRPPKQTVSEDNKENNIKPESEVLEEEQYFDGEGRRKRRIKVPTRFQEAIQGEEMDRIFKEEGVLEDDSEADEKTLNSDQGIEIKEIIGLMEGRDGENLGELVFLNKSSNKIRVRPKSMSSLKKKKKYECDICSRVFWHAGRLEVHKSFHRNVNYLCDTDDCGTQTDSRSAMEVHLKETGHTRFTLLETIEDSSISKADMLKLATLGIDNSSESQENKAQEQPRESPLHLEEIKEYVLKKEKPDNDKFHCNQCDKSFSCKQNYEIHTKAIHENQKPFRCEKCDKTFSYMSSFKTHMQQHSEKIYPCEVCNKVFNHPSSVVYHREAEHNNGRRFVCIKCKKTFKHKQLLLRHQLVHSNLRPHVCKLCNASFKTRANLQNHIPTHTGERKYSCNRCSKYFAHKTSLNLHLRWHDGAKPYECDICLKSFSQKGNLAEHKRIHTGEKPFSCNYCGRKFTTSSQYKNHVRRHTGERPYQCEYCSKTFLHKDTWKSHTRRHINDRPYQCIVCMRAFTEHWALKKHMRLHTGEKPYSCEFCNKSFADASNLAKHKKIHLKKQQQDDKSGSSVKVLTSNQGEKILYLTYDDESSNQDQPQTVVQIMDSLDQPLGEDQNQSISSVLTPEAIIEGAVEDIEAQDELQDVLDNAGNPIIADTGNGEEMKVVTRMENGKPSIYGLLDDGTLVTVDLFADDDKSINEQLTTSIEKTDEKIIETRDTQLELTVSTDDQLLGDGIEFLTEDGQKLDNNIQFLSEDGENFCFVTTYPSEDSISSEYLTIS